ncbi:IS200/IS605 family transposase [Streptomyces sp. NPDC060064]|uniref:IS200/IS605 family transposase n=1 Tax=Streptomyces sp. NPDC060064 TaxID=3347049 RepID=UPI0036C26A37
MPPAPRLPAVGHHLASRPHPPVLGPKPPPAPGHRVPQGDGRRFQSLSPSVGRSIGRSKEQGPGSRSHAEDEECRLAARTTPARAGRTRPRRSFTLEFKAEIVELCERGECSVGQVAKDFDVTETAVRLPPKVHLSKLVNSLKGVSSRRLRQEYDAHVRRYLWGGHFWSGSYFAGSCGGAPLTVVKQSIENQQRPAG